MKPSTRWRHKTLSFFSVLPVFQHPQVLLNPFYEVNTAITSSSFDLRVRALLKRHFWLPFLQPTLDELPTMLLLSSLAWIYPRKKRAQCISMLILIILAWPRSVNVPPPCSPAILSEIMFISLLHIWPSGAGVPTVNKPFGGGGGWNSWVWDVCDSLNWLSFDFIMFVSASLGHITALYICNCGHFVLCPLKFHPSPTYVYLQKIC